MIKKVFFIFGFFLLSGCALFKPQPTPLQVKVNQYINDRVTQDGFNRKALEAILSQAVVDPTPVQGMNHPIEGLPWDRYQRLYVRPTLIAHGAEFWTANTVALNNAAKQYHVPPQIIIALLGVETNYGGNEGQVRALDALYTLAFVYPRREAYFQKELTQFLILTKEGNFDPLLVKSSYAGALGMPQFMPSSYRKYAVSETKNFPNLFTNPADAIGSIGNYLAAMGWHANAPITVRARFGKGVKLTPKLENDTLTLTEFKKAGIHAPYPLDGDLKVDLIKLDTASGPQYWLAFHNFYVIKRYNGNNLYTMAVVELAGKVKEAHDHKTLKDSDTIP